MSEKYDENVQSKGNPWAPAASSPTGRLAGSVRGPALGGGAAGGGGAGTGAGSGATIAGKGSPVDPSAVHPLGEIYGAAPAGGTVQLKDHGHEDYIDGSDVRSLGKPKDAAPPPKDMKTRVVGVSVVSDGTRIRLGRGAKHGATEGMSGYLVDGATGRTRQFKVIEVAADKCYAILEIEVRHVPDDVVLNPSHMPGTEAQKGGEKDNNGRR